MRFFTHIWERDAVITSRFPPLIIDHRRNRAILLSPQSIRPTKRIHRLRDIRRWIRRPRRRDRKALRERKPNIGRHLARPTRRRRPGSIRMSSALPLPLLLMLGPALRDDRPRRVAPEAFASQELAQPIAARLVVLLAMAGLVSICV